MIIDLLQFTGFMLFLGVFSFGGIIVCSLVCEKHRVVRTEAIEFEDGKDAVENR